MRNRVFIEPEGVSNLQSMDLVLVGHMPEKVEQITAPFPHHGLGIVCEGRGSFLSAGMREPTAVEAPFVFYFSPGNPLRYGPRAGETWDERFVALTGKRVKEWTANGWWPASSGLFALKDFSEAVQIHERVLRFMERADPGEIDRAKLLVEKLVLLLHQERRREGVAPGMERAMRQMVRGWRENPRNPIDLHEAAASLRISYSLFRKRFKSETGLSPYQCVLNVRIDHACSLLVQTDMPVKAISYECGFDYVESFNRAFLKVKGCAPGVYRERVTHGVMRDRSVS